MTNLRVTSSGVSFSSPKTSPTLAYISRRECLLFLELLQNLSTSSGLFHHSENVIDNCVSRRDVRYSGDVIETCVPRREYILLVFRNTHRNLCTGSTSSFEFRTVSRKHYLCTNTSRGVLIPGTSSSASFFFFSVCSVLSSWRRNPVSKSLDGAPRIT